MTRDEIAEKLDQIKDMLDRVREAQIKHEQRIVRAVNAHIDATRQEWLDKLNEMMVEAVRKRIDELVQDDPDDWWKRGEEPPV